MTHGEIVSHLEREHAETSSNWWRQSIAVGYERARGKRAVGQTADVGFQVGVQRTIATSAAEAWDLIVARPELWLGDGARVTFEKGTRYELSGASGEIRVVKPRDRLRMTWQPDGWPAPATLQLTLLESASGKTAINAHLEKLPDAEAREAMRAHWRAVLERVVLAAQPAAGHGGPLGPARS
jgi:uncharacterized protein YndB with AHSA1/START domain